MKNITILGAGYVGMSLSVLLAQSNNVTVVDINQVRVNLINNNQSTIKDDLIDQYLQKKDLTLSAVSSLDLLTSISDIFIISAPTNYDPESDSFDVSIVENIINEILKLPNSAPIVIKSTIPIGFTKHINRKLNTNRVMFSPEFLREGQALHDNLYPSRIVCGSDELDPSIFVNLMVSASLEADVPVLTMGSESAEAVKLFANTYLAMRVAFFNELDTYALTKNLDTRNIIKGISLDSRIGDHYNNPSFGYGGYCLPKDTKQLLSNFKSIPQQLIEAIVTSNDTRINFIYSKVIENNPSTIGIYRLVMKNGSDNFRSSAMEQIINKIKLLNPNIELIVYEPACEDELFMGLTVLKDLDIFKKKSSIILANRDHPELSDTKEKVFSRDIFHVD
ncbi:nucleotide sugar dehydrogenase [Gammaproteobacteria bacterium]|nr:nucleotide sugar dehydrogenase [Gammaproteobacteria bacterium]MDA9626386.1 nucleotide sugar dehydrogenase [Pseudomonadota bacterium]